MINLDIIKKIINIALQIESQQTTDEISEIEIGLGEAYNSVKVAATIAVNLALRIAGAQPVPTREISPLTTLIKKAEEQLRREMQVDE